MGASSFTEISKGKTAQEAFENAVDEALYMYGQEPYSGTIKEKGSFREITVPPTWKKSAEDYAYKCMDDGICMEKWGPAIRIWFHWWSWRTVNEIKHKTPSGVFFFHKQYGSALEYTCFWIEERIPLLVQKKNRRKKSLVKDIFAWDDKGRDNQIGA